MKKYLFLGFVLLWVCGCGNVEKKYPVIIGNLRFSDLKIDWKEVNIGKTYDGTIGIFNPTDQDVRVSIFQKPSEVKVIDYGKGIVAGQGGDFVLPKRSATSLHMAFAPCDTALIGSYTGHILWAVNEEVYLKSVEVIATVSENFDSLDLKSVPKIELEKDTLSFGRISGNEKAMMFLKINNRGESNLILRKIETDCSCTAIVTGACLIKSGDSLSVKVEFNPMGKKGRQYRTVRIFCNDPERPVLKVMVRAEVI